MGVGGTVSDIYTQRSAVPQVSTYDNLPQSEQRLILISISKIIRAYRNYRKRILCNGIINQNYATQRSGAFQTASFDYTGGKDERGLKHGFGIQKWKDGTIRTEQKFTKLNQADISHFKGKDIFLVRGLQTKK